MYNKAIEIDPQDVNSYLDKGLPLNLCNRSLSSIIELIR